MKFYQAISYSYFPTKIAILSFQYCVTNYAVLSQKDFSGYLLLEQFFSKASTKKRDTKTITLIILLHKSFEKKHSDIFRNPKTVYDEVFFAKIVNKSCRLTIFAKTFHHKYLILNVPCISEVY